MPMTSCNKSAAPLAAQNGGIALLGLEDKQGIAREVKCSVRTVDHLMAKRAIPFFKLGRLVRFDVAKVKAALARFEVREVGYRKGARE
jgi:excisionase family DNA binding protein